LKVSIGLGNPGRKYARTRHNVGFLLVNRVAGKYGIRITREGFHSSYGSGTIGGEKVFIVKPSTYMNLSGKTASSILSYYSIPPENLIVAHDDIDIATGSVKVKLGGGDAGHRGVRSITELIGTREYYGKRIGVGRPPERMEVEDYVLSRVSKEEEELVADSLEKAEVEVAKILEKK